MLKHAWSDLLVRNSCQEPSNQIASINRSCGATVYVCARKSEDKVSEHCLTKLFVIASIDNLYHFLGYYKSQLKRTREEAESEARMLWNEVKKLRMMTEILAEDEQIKREERERHDSTEKARQRKREAERRRKEKRKQEWEERKKEQEAREFQERERRWRLREERMLEGGGRGRGWGRR